MSKNCPLCGADISSGEQCRDRFDQCLAWEFENPAAFGKVHFLTVACYMLQHNAYSQKAWLETREMVAQFVRQGISPANLSRRNRQRLDGSRRDWSITRGAKLVGFDAIIWSRTIADIRVNDPDIYCADIERWAKSIVEDTEIVVQKFAL